MTNFIAQIARTVFTSREVAKSALPRRAFGGGDQPCANEPGPSQRLGRWIIPLVSLLISLLWLGAGVAPVYAQIIDTVAGGGIGDGGPGTSAVLNLPRGAAVDSSGNLYIADTNNHRVRKVTAATGLISTVAGIGGNGGYNGDNIAATSAMLLSPSSVAVDQSGDIYIADTSNQRIRKVTAATGLISTVAGTGGNGGYNGDNIAATSAMLLHPFSVAVDSSGNLYIADVDNHRIRKVIAATGVITTLAGTGSQGNIGDNIAATSAFLGGPSGIVLDAFGNVYIADAGTDRIRKVTTATGIITTVAGTGVYGYNGDNISATSATLGHPSGVALDALGNLYIADQSNDRIRKVTAATGLISTVAGTGTPGYNGDNIAATSAALSAPLSVAFDSSGNLYVVEQLNHRVRKVAATTGVITTVAGSVSSNSSGDGAAALNARLNSPQDVTVDSTGNLYVADQDNHRIRKVMIGTGVITTVAGTGAQGYNGDDIAATSATLNRPNGVAVDSVGNLYILDNGNYRIRKVSAATGIITTAAGPAGICDATGSGTASCNPVGVALDSSGNLYFADTAVHRIRKVTIATGVVSTVAGTGQAGYNGDDIAATSATMNTPTGIAVDSSDNLYFADTHNFSIRKVSAVTGVITRVAGIGGPPLGITRDNIAATSFTLTNTYAVKADSSGNLFITDSNHIRKVTAATGILTGVAGNGAPGYDGDGQAASTATLNSPKGVAVESSGNLYISDTGNNRIRKVSAPNYQGLWWNAPAGSESGWGINFAHQGSVIFATWFTYDTNGRPLWLSMTTNKIGTDYIGTLYQTRGPPFRAIPFDPAGVTRTAVGSGTLTFSDADAGSFAYIFNGTTQSKSITRQVFGPLPTCTSGAQENLALATNYQDIWWAAPGGIESGWGVNFTHQGDTIFATWFTYDGDGTPLWLSATASKSGVGAYTGMLFRTTGPAFNAVPFLSANVGRTAVGTLTLTFANGNSGTFAYTVNGVTQSKSITRQVFGAPGTVCQ